MAWKTRLAIRCATASSAPRERLDGGRGVLPSRGRSSAVERLPETQRVGRSIRPGHTRVTSTVTVNEVRRQATRLLMSGQVLHKEARRPRRRLVVGEPGHPAGFGRRRPHVRIVPARPCIARWRNGYLASLMSSSCGFESRPRYLGGRSSTVERSVVDRAGAGSTPVVLAAVVV